MREQESNHLRTMPFTWDTWNYPAVEILSVDVKFIPKGLDDFKFLVVATCEITDLVLAIPFKTE